MASPDVLVIGGGIAGLSAAAALSDQARVTVLEAEQQVGFHSSGRSATMVHYALGDRLVRALTHASRPAFENSFWDHGDSPLAERRPALVHAGPEELDGLDALYREIVPFAALDRLGETDLAEICPVLKLGSEGSVAGLLDPNALRIDSNGLLQACVRRLKRSGNLVTGARLTEIRQEAKTWTAETESGERFNAPILVNAAGAWADTIAAMAGVRPLGLTPLRRTIITFDAPAGLDVSRLPFTKTVGEQLYFGAEGGRLFASPMDEVLTDPCDAQPEDYDIALAAWRMEERTSARVEQIRSRWAGLRTFTPDRRPAVGFDPDIDGFFWLAGQGGFGLQTSPAVSAAVASLIAGTAWPFDDTTAKHLSPARFLG